VRTPPPYALIDEKEQDTGEAARGREGTAAAAGIVSFYIPWQSGAAICDYLASYDTGVLVSPCESTQHAARRTPHEVNCALPDTRPLLLIYWCVLACINLVVCVVVVM
jgi:hypothetical protein